MADPLIAIVVPVLRRAHRVEPLLRSIRHSTPIPYRILFVASPGDHDEIAELVMHNAEYLIVDRSPGPGDYAYKINEGYRATTEPYIFTGADDLHFHPGWDTAALARFDDPNIGVVGTNDLGNPQVLAGVHSTHSLVARWYADRYAVYDQPGAIYSESYIHEFLDNELVNVAKLHRAWAFAGDSVVEHLHPNWRKAPTDALYDQAPQRLPLGRPIYQRRRREWTRQIRFGRRRVRPR